MAETVSYARLEDEVLQLPRDERSLLASKLPAGLDEDVFEPTPEWSEELQRRVKEIDGNRARMIPAKEVWDSINQRFGADC